MKIIFLPIFMVCYSVYSMEEPEDQNLHVRAIALRTFTNKLVRETNSRIIPQDKEKTILNILNNSDKELEKIEKLAHDVLAREHQRERYEEMEQKEKEARQRLFLVSQPLIPLKTEIERYPKKAKL